jgi:hypothetical protein
MQKKIRKEGSGGARVKAEEKRKKRVKKQLSLDKDLVALINNLTADEYNSAIRKGLTSSDAFSDIS